MANSRVCSIPDCGKTHKARGLCKMHYKRLSKHGDPMVGAAITRSGEAKEYYETVVLAYEGDECLIWPYARTRDGYGAITKDGKSRIVSRLVCEAANGAPPTPRHEAAHSCGKGSVGCVAKGHLSWKTSVENSADSIIHGTSDRRERSGVTKLTESQVREIISSRDSLSLTKAAKMFGVSRVHICNIRSGRAWAS